MRACALALGVISLIACADSALARDGCGRGMAWNGYACVPAAYRPAPAPPPPTYYYGGRNHVLTNRYGLPGGNIIGHGAAVGCGPSQSRIVQPGGTACAEVP
jgi:hypothetical protein